MDNYLKSIGFKSTRSGLVMQGALLKDTHLDVKDPRKLTNTINIFLINLNIVLYYS